MTFPFSFVISLLDATPSLITWDYWAAVVQNFFGCTFGSFAAIYVAYKIYEGTNKTAKKDKELEARHSLIYFRDTIKTVVEVAKHQTENLKQYCEKINKTNLYLPELTFQPMYSLKRISEGGSLDQVLIAYIRQFTDEKDIKEFNQLINKIDYFLSQFLLLPEEVRLAATYDHERKIQYEQLFKATYTLLGEYIMINDPTLSTEFGIETGKVMDEYGSHHTDNYDLAFFHQYFFVPMNDVLVTHLPKLGAQPTIIQLSNMTRDGKVLFAYIKSQNDVSRKNMEEVLPNLEDSYKDLQEKAAKILSYK